MSRAGSNLTPTPDESTPTFKFRLAEPNHKTGPYDDPATRFAINPYDDDQALPDDYTSTSPILNVDTTSLASKVNGDFFGFPRRGMVLKGLTSGAQSLCK